MKRFFRNLKTLAMCAVVGVATLAVSCSQPYDDTQIKADIEDLKTRVEALEIKLGNEVKALKDLIDAKVAELNDAIDAVEDKIAILDYTANEDGSYTLTTKDGEEITVYPQFTENNEGLLTVQADERGNYYWAQIVNGAPVALTDADGNKYYAHHATVVPEIPEATQVRQDENGANEVSFDGGQTWHKLGGGGDLGLFQSVTVSEDGKSITFVLNGGQSFTTSLPEEFKFDVKSGKLFLAPAAQAEVGLTMVSVADVAVISKPEGWKADVNGTKMVVTAPAAEAIEAGADEMGYVKVLAITNENKAVFGKLVVSAAKGYGIAVVDGNIVVTNEMTMEINDYGMIYTVHPMLAYGFMPKPEGNAAEYLANSGLGGMYGGYEYFYANDYNYNMVDAENPVYTATLTPDDFGFVFEPGVEYVLWVTPFTQGQGYWDPWVINADDVVYTTYVQREFSVKVVSTSAFDIQIDVINSGYAGCQVYFAEADYADGEWEFGRWQSGSQGYFGFERNEASFSGSLFDYGYDPDGWASKIEAMPGSEYYLAVLPLVDGKPRSEYTFDDAQVYFLSTGDAVAGGTIVPTITVAEGDLGYNNVKGTFNAEGAKVVYYNYYREAAWNEEMDTWSNDQWAAAVMTGGYMKTTTSFTYNLTALNQGETIRFAAVAVDANGQYGEVTVETFTTKVFTFSETFTVNAVAETKDKTVSIALSTEGGEAVKYRYCNTNQDYTWDYTYGGNVESAGKYIATSTQTYYYKEVTPDQLVDGKLVIEGLNYNSTYHFVVIAYDAEGNVSKPVGCEYTPEMDVDFLLDADGDEPADEGYATGEPTVELVSCVQTDESENPDWICYTVDIKVTPSAEAATTYVAVFDESYENTYTTPFTLMQYIVSQYTSTYPDYYIQYGYSMVPDGETTYTIVEDSSIYNSKYIYITWCTEDENGYRTFRQCKKINVRTFAGLPLLEESEEEE